MNQILDEHDLITLFPIDESSTSLLGKKHTKSPWAKSEFISIALMANRSSGGFAMAA